MRPFLTCSYLILRLKHCEPLLTKSETNQFSLAYCLGENAQELPLNLEVKFIAQAHLWFRLLLSLCETQALGEILVIWDADCFICPSPSKCNLWK